MDAESKAQTVRYLFALKTTKDHINGVHVSLEDEHHKPINFFMHTDEARLLHIALKEIFEG